MAAAVEVRDGTVFIIAGIGNLDTLDEQFKGVYVRLAGCAQPIIAIQSKTPSPSGRLNFSQKIDSDRITRGWFGLNYSALKTARMVAVTATENIEHRLKEFVIDVIPLPPFQPALYYQLNISRSSTDQFQGEWECGEIANLENFHPELNTPSPTDWVDTLFDHAVGVLHPEQPLAQDRQLEQLSPYELCTQLAEWTHQAQYLTRYGLSELTCYRHALTWPRIQQFLRRLQNIQKKINALQFEINRRGIRTVATQTPPQS